MADSFERVHKDEPLRAAAPSVGESEVKLTLDYYMDFAPGPQLFELDSAALVEVDATDGHRAAWRKRLHGELEAWCHQHGGWTAMSVGAIPGALADVVYVAPEHTSAVANGRLVGTPDIVVEIFDSARTRHERVRQLDVQSGIAWFWMVDTERDVIEEYGVHDGMYALTAAAPHGSPFRPRALLGLELAPAPRADRPPPRQGDTGLQMKHALEVFADDGV